MTAHFALKRLEQRTRTLFYLVGNFTLVLAPLCFFVTFASLLKLPSFAFWCSLLITIPFSLWFGQILSLTFHPWLIRAAYRTESPQPFTAVYRAYQEIYSGQVGPALRLASGGPMKNNVFVTGVLSRGATIYIDRELSAQFTVSEWKSILSHEIGHLELGHVARRIHRGFLLTVLSFGAAIALLVAVQFIGGSSGLTGLAWILGAISLIAVASDQKRLRLRQEIEADGFSCLLDAGHLKALPQALQKMNLIHGFESHPVTDLRISEIEKLAPVLARTPLPPIRLKHSIAA